MSVDDTSPAEVTPLEQTAAQLAAQVDALDQDGFGHRDAWALGLRIAELAEAGDLPITAAIWLGEQRVFHIARPGTSADNDSWMDRKAAVVRRYNEASFAVLTRMRAHGVTRAEPWLGLDPATHAFAGGGIPLRVRGCLVGALVVSGLTGADDHALAVQALATFRRGDTGA